MSSSVENINGNASVDHDELASPPPIGPKGTIESGTERQTFLQKVKHALKKNAKPERPVGDAPGFWQGIKAIVFGSWLNLLLVCIPISWAVHFAVPGTPLLIFVFSFLAIIPLAKLLAIATDELSMRVGQTMAGLLNATLGNAVELIVAIIAIVKCELQITQSSLVGSILSNLLLVLGMCFFAGGMKYSEQGFGASATQINASLLTISVIAVLLPAAFHLSVQPDPNGDDPLTNGAEGSDILKMSHGVAVILLFIYVAYLVFQLWSHANLFDDNLAFTSTRYGAPVKKSLRTLRRRVLHPRHAREKTLDGQNGDATGVELEANHEEHEEDDVEVPTMSVAMCIGLLVAVTVLVAVTAEFLVDSINGVNEQFPALKKEWVGLILLPIAGNAAEHVTAVAVAVKDKLNLSIGVAVGSSIQIALFVIPLMVVIAWILGKPLLMLFDPFESVTLFLAVLTVNYCVQDGKSNWLEGMILMCKWSPYCSNFGATGPRVYTASFLFAALYVIVAVCFWFYPGSDIQTVLATCT
ncbi:calcium/proton exchanger [Schizopora paradoxa]|uniref:Calcium/proton exchanger n=1 Tax=Schizopora paradoxa TaxID=27342 RepID=A0A0H2RVP6_9AGAM|nr:calcium/proton exchanger [Schizopora paradoxa]